MNKTKVILRKIFNKMTRRGSIEYMSDAIYIISFISYLSLIAVVAYDIYGSGIGSIKENSREMKYPYNILKKSKNVLFSISIFELILYIFLIQAPYVYLIIGIIFVLYFFTMFHGDTIQNKNDYKKYLWIIPYLTMATVLSLITYISYDNSKTAYHLLLSANVMIALGFILLVLSLKSNSLKPCETQKEIEATGTYQIDSYLLMPHDKFGNKINVEEGLSEKYGNT
jgi:hypothetical protein